MGKRQLGYLKGLYSPATGRRMQKFKRLGMRYQTKNGLQQIALQRIKVLRHQDPDHQNLHQSYLLPGHHGSDKYGFVDTHLE